MVLLGWGPLSWTCTLAGGANTKETGLCESFLEKMELDLVIGRTCAGVGWGWGGDSRGTPKSELPCRRQHLLVRVRH